MYKTKNIFDTSALIDIGPFHISVKLDNNTAEVELTFTCLQEVIITICL